MPNQMVFIFFVGLVFLILATANWALYSTIIRFFTIENQALVQYLRIIFGFLSVSFVLASILSFRYDNLAVTIFYNFAAGWLGFLYLFLIASAILWVLKIFHFILPVNFVAVFFTISVLIGFYGLVNANNVQISQLKIKLNNLPENWSGKSVVFLSDIHLGNVRRASFSDQLAKKINNLNPDAVFVGGDLFDGGEGNYDELAEPFGKIKPPLGMYFVTGNHEEFNGNEKFLLAAQKTGMQVLNNEKVDLDGIQLIGVDYEETSNLENYRRILNRLEIDRRRPSILLKHSPYHVEESEKAGIDLQLSGHTHQGQIYPIQYISRQIYYGYEFGLQELESLLIYTSSGAGTWGPPIRLGTTPEIVKITFQTKS